MSKLKKLALGVPVIILVVAAVAYIAAGWSLLPMDENARAKAPGSFLSTSQGQIHYQWYGEDGAPIVVMAHGLSTPSFVFEQNAQALAQAGFRVLTFDHLGRGWSDRPSAQYDDEFYQREMVDVFDGLNLNEPVGLVGLSMGGLITSDFSARNPQRVKALFLFVPAGLNVGDASRSASRQIIRTPILGDWAWGVFGKRVLLGQAQYNETPEDPQNALMGDIGEQMEYRGYLEALLATYRNMKFSAREDVYAELGKTGIPVKALFGSEDAVVTPDSQKTLKTYAPRAEALIIEGGGHGLNYGKSAEANGHLVSFFRAHMGENLGTQSAVAP